MDIGPDRSLARATSDMVEGLALEPRIGRVSL